MSVFDYVGKESFTKNYLKTLPTPWKVVTIVKKITVVSKVIVVTVVPILTIVIVVTVVTVVAVMTLVTEITKEHNKYKLTKEVTFWEQLYTMLLEVI